MSFWWILLIAFCVGLTLLSVLIAIVLFSPVILIVDSRNRAIRARWLGLLDFLVPLPGGEGNARFSIAGRPVGFQPGETKREFAKKEPGLPRQPRTGRVLRFLWRCMRSAPIRGAVSRQIANLVKHALKSFDVARLEGKVSLPDPALNGMLGGKLAWSHLGRAIGIRVNFKDENSLFCEVRLYPYRVARAFLFFAFGMPYRAIFRQWRAAQ